jgi:hypothetical protein
VFGDVGARAALHQLGVARDFEWRAASEAGKPTAVVDYIHRRTDDAEIYYVANRENRRTKGTAVFRVHGKRPEIWDPVTSEKRAARVIREEAGRTEISLQLEPEQSVFVVFRAGVSAVASASGAKSETADAELTPMLRIQGPWTVRFDPTWGGPAEVVFDELVDWTKRSEEGIRHYSGAAWYETTFRLPRMPADERLHLDLGELKNLAVVELNGQSLGVLWMSPFRVDATAALREGENRLRVKIVNLWPNRLIGDQKLQPEARRTRTNITKFEQPANQTLRASGLFGPVQVLRAP